EREALEDVRQRLNAEAKSGQQQLQAAWHELRQQQDLMQEQRQRERTDFVARAQVLRQRENALAQDHQALSDDQRDWQLKLQILQQEAQGLENRVINQRQKLIRNWSDVQCPMSDVQRIVSSEAKPLSLAVLTPDIGHRSSDMLN